MEGVLVSREEEIEELVNFTQDTSRILEEVVSGVGWTMKSVGNVEETLICPFNSSHRLCQKSVEKHIEHCLWKAEGYGEDDLPLSVPSVPPDAPTCLKLDEQLAEDIIKLAKLQDSSQVGVGYRLIPRTSDRLFTNFTPAERRVLYDYVVSNTEQPSIGEDIADLNKPKRENGESKTSSYLELVAQERNLKRRRAKHRGVHTNKKSLTEITREVINQQMEMLAEYLAEKNPTSKIPSDAELSRWDYEPPKRQHRDSSRETNHGHQRNSSRESVKDFSNVNHHRHSSKRNSDHHYNSKHHSENHRNEDRHSKHSSRSSRDRDSDDRRSRRHSEERKKHKKHDRHRSRDRHHDKHRKHESKSSKRSRDREDSRARKRRKSP